MKGRPPIPKNQKVNSVIKGNQYLVQEPLERENELLRFDYGGELVYYEELKRKIERLYSLR